MEKKKKKKNSSLKGYFKKSDDSGNDDNHYSINTVDQHYMNLEEKKSYKSMFSKSPIGLVAYYRCTEGRHKTVGDSSGCGRIAYIKNDGNGSGDSPWMFKIKNKEILNFDNLEKKHKKNYCLNVSGKSNCYIEIPSDNCLELLGGNYSTNENSIKIKQEICQNISNDINEGFAFEMWIGLEEKKIKKKKEKKSYCLIQKGVEYSEWSIYLIIDGEECNFLINYKNQNFEFDKFPIAHLKTIKYNNYYWSYVSIVFNIGIDLIFVILSGEYNYFFDIYKNKYAIFYNNSLYPTNFYLDSKNVIPLCIGKYNSHLNNLKNMKMNKNSKGDYEVCSFLVTEIRMFAVSRSADLAIEKYNQPLECLSSSSLKSDIDDRSDNNDKMLKSNNNSENDYYKCNSSDDDPYNYNSKHGDANKKEKKKKKEKTDIDGNKINKHKHNPYINDENIYKRRDPFFENYNDGSEENDNQTIEYKCSEFNNEIEEMKKKFNQFNDEIKSMDINNERFSFGSEKDKEKKKKKKKKHESDNDSEYEKFSDDSNRKFTHFSFENNSKDFIKNEGSSSDDLNASNKSQTFYDDSRKNKKEKREGKKEMKKNSKKKHESEDKGKNVHIDEVIPSYLNPENDINLKNNNISFFNFSDEDIFNADGNNNNNEGREKKDSKNKMENDEDLFKKVGKDNKSEEKLRKKKGSSFHDITEVNKDEKINMAEIISEINKNFENKLFDMFADKWVQNLGVSQNDRDKFLENLKKQRDFIDLEKKKKKPFNNSEESKNSDMNEYEDIKRKYNELIEKKELEKKKKIQENLKEEIKRTKEQSLAEKGLTEFIQKNKQMNEYYVKKYRILSPGSRKSDASMDDESDGEKSNTTDECSIDNTMNEDYKREDSLDESLNFENRDFMNKKTENSFDSCEFAFSKNKSKDEMFDKISKERNDRKKTDSTDLVSFEHDVVECEENEKKRIYTSKADNEINIGKQYYRYICPLTHYEIYIIKNFHKHGINKELKQFKNKDTMGNEKYNEDKRIARNSININYIKYKISMMKYLNNMSLKYILEKKYTKGLKACIKNKNYIQNFTNSYCSIQNRIFKKNYQIVNICLNVNYSKNITIDELKVIIKNNVINIIVCKIFILIYEYKRYKYIENSSRILVLLSVLCRILYISNELNNRSSDVDKLLKKVLKKFIIRLFLRGCLYYVEKTCEYFFKLYPRDFIKYEENTEKEEEDEEETDEDPIQTSIHKQKDNTNSIIYEIYKLSKNTFLKYAISYKSNKCSLINNHEMDFENSIKTFSPEWGYYIYSTSNFNIFSSSIKYNGFLKTALDISSLISSDKYESFLSNNPMCIRDINELEDEDVSKLDQIGDVDRNKDSDETKEEKENDLIDVDEANNNNNNICLPDASDSIVPLPEHAGKDDILCKMDIKNNNNITLIDYLTNYEKKMKNYYIIDDTLKTIKFNRKKTNYNLEKFFKNHNINSNINFTDQAYFQNFMKKVNHDAFLNASKYSYKNKELFGNCPYCKKQLTTFSNICDSCHKRIYICYYFFVYCTYKYRCQLCDATYSEMCMKKFKMGFTCFYCGLFLVKE
ncbi:conserved Plasmodium protein, unknown function [Plasmodium chabaudi chabaudi]|uniref:Uncharacterized protein n=1 Tax=Plasmodium chabaudi chabaudi TaxID=31271 RepID=A0A4V6Z8I6_PLACU|nr:conserved Plasmodium protein, unknown function [Plasmodium chabaudi chabaudi]VTZ66269.1 conserved Plasmodium protein, unknown function [Plasmodium chabaudi chabaudi]|eukprot:XP_016653003.1 conserved Plasmodium protein, unknown function [Plasmodium chabaudi chabaudi]